MKEYRLTEGWTIVVYTFAPILILASGWSIVNLFLSNSSILHFVLLAPLSLIVIGLMIWGLLDAKKLMVYKTDVAIGIKSTLANRELKFDEIEGFRVGENFITIMPKESGKKRIKISIYLAETEELLIWLRLNLRNLNAQEKEKKSSLKQPGAHLDQAERLVALKRAEGHSEVLNIFGCAVAGWAALLPQPYWLIISLSIAIPLLCIVAVLRHRGFMLFVQQKHSAYPSILWGLLAPIAALVLRSILDFNIADYSGVWLACAIMAIMGITVVWYFTNQIHPYSEQGYVTALVLPFIFFGFAFGTIITTNCHFDNNEGVVHSAQVLDKWAEDDELPTYHLELSIEKLGSEIVEASVSESIYKRAELEGQVNIEMKQGLYGIPWYVISD